MAFINFLLLADNDTEIICQSVTFIMGTPPTLILDPRTWILFVALQIGRLKAIESDLAVGFPTRERFSADPGWIFSGEILFYSPKSLKLD